jgi:hypothetical protein
MSATRCPTRARWGRFEEYYQQVVKALNAGFNSLPDYEAWRRGFEGQMEHAEHGMAFKDRAKRDEFLKEH